MAGSDPVDGACLTQFTNLGCPIWDVHANETSRSLRAPQPLSYLLCPCSTSSCLRQSRTKQPGDWGSEQVRALGPAFDSPSRLSFCCWRAMAPAAPTPASQMSPRSSHWALCHHTAPVVCGPLTYFPQLSFTGVFSVPPIVPIVYSVLTSPPFFCFDQKSSFHLVPTEFSTILIPALLSELKN